MEDQTEIACRLMGPELAARKEKITRELFAHAEETLELEDGFAYRFSSATPQPQNIFEFIEAERVCCPFLRFEVEFEPNHGPIWLRLRGPSDVKSFIEHELGLASFPEMAP